MKHIFLPVIIFLSIGLLTSCGGSNKQTSETEQSRYGINYSDTSTIKKDHKNVLVISSSPRREGNTDLLCDEFVRGAKEAGARVEKIFLEDENAHRPHLLAFYGFEEQGVLLHHRLRR